jgi:predicted DNA-binding transcriptional regulator AlpA
MKLLTNVQTAALLGLKPNTLEIWRVHGRGPVFRKLGRTVRYAEVDVLAWIDLHVCASTSEYEPRHAVRVPGQLTTVV